MLDTHVRRALGPARVVALTLALASGAAHAEDSADTSWMDPANAAEGVDSTVPEGDKSFGTELDFLGLDVSWSGYGDVIFSNTPGTFTFDAYHFNPILGARLGKDVWAELELEFEHGGSEILVEYGLLDFTPHPEISLRLGQFLVPVGEWNDTFHPSFRWLQVTRPSMFKDVVPGVWSDVGVQVFGRLGAGDSAAVYYNVFVVNGLGGDAVDRATEFPIRELRGNVIDNNLDKAAGARARVALFEGRKVGAVSLSVSGYSGELLPEVGHRFTVADAALRLALGPITVQGEFAQNFLGGGAEMFTPFERGAYGQVRGTVGKTTLAGRYDYVDSNIGLHHAVAASCGYQVRTFWNVRGEVAYPIAEGRTWPDASLMSAFYF